MLYYLFKYNFCQNHMRTNHESHQLPSVEPEQPEQARIGYRRGVAAVTNLALGLSITFGAAYSHSEMPTETDTVMVSDESQLDSSAVTNPEPSNTYVISTYNIMGSQFPSRYSLETRMSGVTDIITGQDKAPKSDIVSMQEVMIGKNQYGMLKAKLDNKGYRLFPAASEMRTNVIAYDTDRFTFLNGGYVKYPFYEDSRRGNVWEKSGRAPWVYLEDKKTDQKVATIGARFVAWNTDAGSDRGGAQKRKAGAMALQDWAVDFQNDHPNAVVTIANDDNAVNYMRDKFGVNWTTDNPAVRHKDDALSSRGGLPYCVQTQNPEYLQSAKDSVYGMYGECPDTAHSGKIHDDMRKQKPGWSLTRRNQVLIDAVYFSPRTAAAADWDQNVTPLGRKSSDHHLLWSELVARAIPDGQSVRSVVLTEQTRTPD